MADTYAWINIPYGGEVEQRPAGGNRMMNVVTGRKLARMGDKVSQADLGVDDEQWEAMKANGSIRDYPLPEGTDEYTSPTQAFMKQVVDPTSGEVDVNQLLNMGLQNPGVALTPEQVDAATEEANKRAADEAAAEEKAAAPVASSKSTGTPKGA